MIEQISSVFEPMSTIGVFMVVWIVVMISVPVVRWIGGEGAERIGIAAGVVAQVAVVIAALGSAYGWYSLIVIITVPVIGWASEVLGSKTGFPFGSYHYTDVLQPQVADVPVLIPLAWLMMMPPAWSIGVAIAPSSPILQWVIASAAFAAWDVYLDPMMVSWDFWRWKSGGVYEGIPFVNFVGWFFVALAITALMSLLGIVIGVPLVAGVPAGPLMLVFIVTWLLMFVGQMAFWRLRVSAVAGFVAMGAFVALLITTVGL